MVQETRNVVTLMILRNPNNSWTWEQGERIGITTSQIPPGPHFKEWEFPPNRADIVSSLLIHFFSVEVRVMIFLGKCYASI